MAPSWLQDDPMLVHVGPVWSQVGPKLTTNLAPSRSMLAEVVQRWPKLAPSCLRDGLKLAHVGSCWPQIGSMQACQGVHEGFASKAWISQDFHEGSASGVAKACKGVHEGSASKAWIPQDFHEGSASGVAKACKSVHEGSARPGFSRYPRRLCLRRSDV